MPDFTRVLSNRRTCADDKELGRTENGAPRRNRTADPIITNDVLYQLSYRGTARVLGERPGRASGHPAAIRGAGTMTRKAQLLLRRLQQSRSRASPFSMRFAIAATASGAPAAPSAGRAYFADDGVKAPSGDLRLYEITGGQAAALVLCRLRRDPALEGRVAVARDRCRWRLLHRGAAARALGHGVR